MIRDEANLAWALALAAKPHLDALERNYTFVTIGAGETFAAIHTLLKWVAIKRIPVGPGPDAGRRLCPPLSTLGAGRHERSMMGARMTADAAALEQADGFDRHSIRPRQHGATANDPITET